MKRRAAWVHYDDVSTSAEAEGVPDFCLLFVEELNVSLWIVAYISVVLLSE